MIFKNSLAFIFALFSSGAASANLLDAGKVCLFSKISGVITLNGKPAANAKVIRTVNLNKDKTDYTYTDENGYFEMPAVYQRTVTKFLPQEFVAKQDIVVHHNEKEYDIWSGVKRTREENAEARGENLNVQCELKSEKSIKMVNNSPYISRCVWDTEPDSQRKIF
jgi:hypothetical protein